MTNTDMSGGEALQLVKGMQEKVSDLEGLVFAETNAKQAALEKVAALEAEKAGRQQAVPSGWVPLLIEYDPGYPEEVAFGPQRMMDRLKLWLDKYFAMLAAAPQADSSPLLAKLDISGIGRDAGHPRAVLLYLRHEPSDDDLRTIQEMFRTSYPAPAPAERVEQQAVSSVCPRCIGKGSYPGVYGKHACNCSAPAEWVDEPSFEQYRLAAEFAEHRGVVEKSTNRAIVVDAFATGYGFGITAKPAPAAPDVAGSDVAGLVEAMTGIWEHAKKCGDAYYGIKARHALATFHREG